MTMLFFQLLKSFGRLSRIRFGVLLPCWLAAVWVVAQEPASPSGQPRRPQLDLETVEAMPEGREKLIEVLRFTRNPNNIDTRSEQLLENAVAFAATAGEPSLLSGLLVNQALIEAYRKDHDRAGELLDRASAVADTLQPEEQLAALNAVAIGYRRIHQLDKALAAHERHNAITEGKTDHRMVMHRITNLQNQVNLYHLQRRFDLIKQCNDEVKRLLGWIDDPRLIFNITFNLAGMLIDIDEVEEAATLLNELMPAIERNTDGRAPRFYEMVAEHALRTSDIPRATEFFTKVLHTPTAVPQQRLRSAAQLVRCYIALNRPDSVERYIRMSNELRENPVARYGEANLWLLDAQYAAFRGDDDKAAGWYRKAADAPPGPQGSYAIPAFEAQVELAALYRRKGVADSVRYYLAESGRHVRDAHIPRFLKMRYYTVAGATEGGGQPAGPSDKDSLIAALTHQLSLKDSLFDQTSTRAYAEMVSKYNLHEKEQQLRLSRQEQEIQSLQMQRQEQRIWIFVLVASALILLLVFVSLLLARRRKQARERHQYELQQLAQQHRIDTARALKEAEEEERRRIAGKLHDEVGAQLSVTRLNIDQLEADTFAPDSAAGAKLKAAQRLLGEMSETVRAISHSLMPVALEKYGLKAAVIDLLNAVNASGKIKVEELIDGLDDTDGWSNEFRFGIYRIIHEIINNIIKHAQATHVLVQLIELEQSVTLYIEDNGKGLDSNSGSSGAGLKLLRRNIEYLNGAIEINGRENKGTFVLIELPLESGTPA